ncbi:MAG TPA: hypothetical protein VFW94_10820 [Candidatus Acidoferrales bacterium]|nr:hypothetical protein [Candidatus Acidoferrales bacterium]
MRQQWDDIKGNVKFSLLMTACSFLLAGGAILVKGMPLWRIVALACIFFILFAWAVAVTFISVKKSTVQLPPAAPNAIAAEIVDGYDDVYDRTLELIRTAKSWGRACVYTNKLPLAPERFVDGLLERLRENPTFKYHLTFIGDLSKMPPVFWTTLDSRFKRMDDSGTRHQFRITFLTNAKDQVGFDVIVLDGIHCCFGFSPVAPTEPATKRLHSFIFENQPAIAERVSRWLENLYPLKEVDEARDIWNELQASATAGSDQQRT